MIWPRWTLTFAAMLGLFASRPVPPVVWAAQGVKPAAAAAAKESRAAGRAQAAEAEQVLIRPR
jgi:hypothetical protein